jgi:hypothetical protein
MIMSITKKRVACGLLAASLGASMLVGSANAEPQQIDGFTVVGSDTTQDILNAFAGYSNGIDYTPIQTAASASPLVRGDRQLVSFDAIKPPYLTSNCIVGKANGPAFWRPNGSGAGRRALNQAQGLGGGWTGPAGVGCGTLVDISGQIDVVRSSALGGTTVSADQTFVPMARDGVSFAYYKPAGGVQPAVTSLSFAELAAIYDGSTAVTVNNVRIVPCGIQTGSGTHSFFRDAVLSDAAQELAATTLCNNATATVGGTALGRMQENEGPALKARGDALNTAGTAGSLNGTEFQVITAFSAAAFIAKTAGLATPAPGPGIALGTITSDTLLGGGVPGNPLTAGAANATFYANTVFGRTVYNVLPVATVDAGGNTPLKQLFVDQDAGPANTSVICNQSSTIQSYGFLPVSDCGSTATDRSWETGAL